MNEVLAYAFDPALFSIASPLNTVLILGEFAYLVNELSKLRRKSEELAQECLRLARGSEERATNAAREISELARHVDKAMAENVVVNRAIRDKLGILKVEQSLGGGDPSRSWPFDRHPEG
jgi:hypothetical protein